MTDMMQGENYPFNLEAALFSSIHIERDNEIVGEFNLPIETQIKVTTERFPQVQINIRFKNIETSPVRFTIELIGLFKYIGEDLESGRVIIKEFVTNRGLFILWPYIVQMIKIITGQMGMVPININMPVSFEFYFPKEEPSQQEQTG